MPYPVSYVFRQFKYIVQPKYMEIYQQEILSIGRKVLEFFCVPFYIDYLSDISSTYKFQVLVKHDTHVEC